MKPLRALRKTLFACLVVGICAVGYTAVAKRLAYGSPPPMAATDMLADQVVVSKSQRRLTLFRDGKLIREYVVSLGANPTGRKQREGDGRTPEGAYAIDWRNGKSGYYLSLHISYPSDDDAKSAAASSVEPGGDIMVHGLPNGWGFLGALHRYLDWTDGCIAVTDSEMREIWSLIPDGTPIEIRA